MRRFEILSWLFSSLEAFYLILTCLVYLILNNNEQNNYSRELGSILNLVTLILHFANT